MATEQLGNGMAQSRVLAHPEVSALQLCPWQQSIARAGQASGEDRRSWLDWTADVSRTVRKSAEHGIVGIYFRGREREQERELLCPGLVLNTCSSSWESEVRDQELSAGISYGWERTQLLEPSLLIAVQCPHWGKLESAVGLQLEPSQWCGVRACSPEPNTCSSSPALCSSLGWRNFVGGSFSFFPFLHSSSFPYCLLY